MDFIRRLAREWGIVIAVVAGCIIIALSYIASHPSAALLPGSQTAGNQSNTARQTASLESSQVSAQPAPQQPQSAAPQAAVPHQNQSEPAPAGQRDSEQKAVAPPMGGDVVAGRQVFRQCQVCHSLEPGKILIGPSLAGVLDRKAGSLPGYDYSPAIRQANTIWDAKTLDAYLADPQRVLPGNKMPFPGLKTKQDRIDVIAYLAASSGRAAQPTD